MMSWAWRKHEPLLRWTSMIVEYTLWTPLAIQHNCGKWMNMAHLWMVHLLKNVFFSGKQTVALPASATEPQATCQWTTSVATRTSGAVVLSVVPLELIDVDFWVGSEDFYIPSVGSDSSDSESQLSPSKYAGGFLEWRCSGRICHGWPNQTGRTQIVCWASFNLGFGWWNHLPILSQSGPGTHHDLRPDWWRILRLRSLGWRNPKKVDIPTMCYSQLYMLVS